MAETVDFPVDLKISSAWAAFVWVLGKHCMQTEPRLLCNAMRSAWLHLCCMSRMSGMSELSGMSGMHHVMLCMLYASRCIQMHPDASRCIRLTPGNTSSPSGLVVSPSLAKLMTTSSDDVHHSTKTLHWVTIHQNIQNIQNIHGFTMWGSSDLIIWAREPLLAATSALATQKATRTTYVTHGWSPARGKHAESEMKKYEESN